ncbi:hypothetical protein ElyMa_000930600 [Elysia marginata]|uniref:Uncharacterized protein n=1 Tax=Elysia marginata TaxID=1093978 RepID=A0AAV4HBI6_9GAST|nr:hypothetical protein ElyMa_000930600 [Elysia marginata]
MYVPIVEEIKKRRRRWLGHVLRMDKSRHPLIALTWNPKGARKKGRPQGIWRRSVENERVESEETWNELNWLTQHRCEWRKFVGALCSQEETSPFRKPGRYKNLICADKRLCVTSFSSHSKTHLRMNNNYIYKQIRKLG